jgi:hypothetical protein
MNTTAVACHQPPPFGAGTERDRRCHCDDCPAVCSPGGKAEVEEEEPSFEVCFLIVSFLNLKFFSIKF